MGVLPTATSTRRPGRNCPRTFKNAWGGDPTVLVRHATSADARKHTDTLEPSRHYLDLDDVLRRGPNLRRPPSLWA